MSTRRRCREVVLQILYEDDLNPERNLRNSEQFLVSRLKGIRPLVEFANGLLRGVRQNRREIDKQLGEKATNWSLRRMAAIDRNILRLAGYEILFGGTPGRVAINEAVELAKRYGDRQSGQFVNGVLDRLLHDQQGADQQGADQQGVDQQGVDQPNADRQGAEPEQSSMPRI